MLIVIDHSWATPAKEKMSKSSTEHHSEEQVHIVGHGN